MISGALDCTISNALVLCAGLCLQSMPLLKIVELAKYRIRKYTRDGIQFFVLEAKWSYLFYANIYIKSKRIPSVMFLSFYFFEDMLIYLFIIVVLGGGTLYHLQRFL
jgi:hypothetical protein